MSRATLSQSFVDRAICPSGQSKHDYFDTQLTGLVLRVMASGKRTYSLRYKDSYGTTKERRLFDASIVSLSEARTEAKRLLAQAALGNDPFAPQATKKEIPTLADFINDHYLPFIKVNKRSWTVDEAMFRRHVIPALGKLYLDQIDPQVVANLTTQHARHFKPASTNRLIGVLSSMFSRAIRWEVPGVTSNPMTAVDKRKENNQRDRVLSAPELSSVIAAVDQSDCEMLPYIVRMYVYTGARRTEVLRAQWTHIDWNNRQWKIPENKSGKVRYVPLSDYILQMLSHMHPASESRYVFANPKTQEPYINIYHSWNKARIEAGVPDVRIHDFRHAAASYMVNIGVSLYEVKDMLGHSNIRTTQRYAHLSHERQLRSSNQLADYINQSTSLIEANGT